MDKRLQLKELNKKIDSTYKIHLNKLYKERKKVEDAIEKENSKELLGKTFVYKNNSYSCPKEKKDYWNVYLKVVGLIDAGIKVLTVEKDSYGCVQIQTENRWNNFLTGYEPCDEKEFERAYRKLMKEIEGLK